jgi:hypothetical protein
MPAANISGNFLPELLIVTVGTFPVHLLEITSRIGRLWHQLPDWCQTMPHYKARAMPEIIAANSLSLLDFCHYASKALSNDSP